MEGTLAQILFFGGNFAPRNWAFCNGQLLAIQSNTALFSLLGTTYGGNGTTTFALPDFRGRVPVGTGQGPGLPIVDLGERAGTESVVLTIQQMPAHTHTATPPTIAVAHTNDESVSPAGNVFATSDTNAYASTSNATAAGTSVSLAPSGGSQPISIINPYLTVNYVICMAGVFPSRN
jgi:microcystin-dependent protein